MRDIGSSAMDFGLKMMGLLEKHMPGEPPYVHEQSSFGQCMRRKYWFPQQLEGYRCR